MTGNNPITSNRATWQLGAVIVVYSLLFIVPSAFMGSAQDAEYPTAALLPPFIVMAVLVTWRTGLARLCGLALEPGGLSLLAKASAPYAIVLLLPVANIVLAWPQGFAEALPRLAIVACAAVVEELVFRGYLMGILLEQRSRPATALWASAIAFAVLHLFGALGADPAYAVAQSVTALGAGLAFGCMRLATRSVIPSMIVHLLVNISSGQSPLHGSWTGWIIAAIAIIAGAWALFWWKRHEAAAH